MVFPAYAKINLGLLVLNRRPDGYHNIATVFHRVNVFDEIAFAQSKEIVVMSSSDEAPGDKTNLCYRAAELLRDRLKIDKGVRITLTKNIPVGAGLGGGSSDAAAVLQHLPAFWKSEVDMSTLREIALRIGSDVPYFLNSGSAAARGRGEILDHFSLDIPYTILLCNPGIHVATGWAYGQITPRGDDGRNDLRSMVIRGMSDPARLQEALVNDFETPVFNAHHAIKGLKQEMIEAGAVAAAMSGSGSSVYGLFNDTLAVQKLADQLQARGCRTFITPPHFAPPCFSAPL